MKLLLIGLCFIRNGYQYESGCYCDITTNAYKDENNKMYISYNNKLVPFPSEGEFIPRKKEMVTVSFPKKYLTLE